MRLMIAAALSASLLSACNTTPATKPAVVKPASPKVAASKPAVKKPAAQAKPVVQAPPKSKKRLYDLTHLKPKNHQYLATRYIKASLKDPDSAKIKVGPLKVEECYAFEGSSLDTSTMPKLKIWTADLLVNGKNSYGAYTGNKLYRYHFDNAGVVGETTFSSDDKICAIGALDRLKAAAR